jgi:hypothetical protein
LHLVGVPALSGEGRNGELNREIHACCTGAPTPDWPVEEMAGLKKDGAPMDEKAVP